MIISNYLKKIREDNFKYVSEITSKETIYESQTDSKVKFYLNNMKFIIKSLIKKIIKS